MAHSSVEKTRISGVELALSPPVTGEHEWIGQVETLRQLLACWLVLDDKDLPLSPRLIGPPGIGKTTLGMAAAHNRNQPLYTATNRPVLFGHLGEPIPELFS